MAKHNPEIVNRLVPVAGSCDKISEKEKLLPFIEEISKKMQFADVVPVVQCKDCKSRRFDGYCTKFQTSIMGIPFSMFMPEDDDFCSYGEKKED